MTGFDHPLTLQAHPCTPAPMIRSLDVDLARSQNGGFRLVYRLFGDMARILIPSPQPTDEPDARCDGLWEHTCFEAFFARAGETAYREFNFSPSGKWAAYDFSAYRKPAGAPAAMMTPQIVRRLSEGRLELEVLLAHDALPNGMPDVSLEIGLSAVVESTDTQDGARSYWALAHPAERPDFHHRDGFHLRLSAATSPC